MRRWTIGQGYVLPVALLVMLLGADVAMPRGPAPAPSGASRAGAGTAGGTPRSRRADGPSTPRALFGVRIAAPATTPAPLSPSPSRDTPPIVLLPPRAVIMAAAPPTTAGPAHEVALGLPLTQLAHGCRATAKAPRPLNLPASADVSDNDPPVADEGPVHAGAAWATGYTLRGWWARKYGDAGLSFAPLSVYAPLTRGQNRPVALDAALAREAHQGIDTQADYWQGRGDYWDAPTRAEQARALQYRLTGFTCVYAASPSGRRPTAPRQVIQSVLAGGQPLVLGVQVFDNVVRASASQPYVDLPAPNAALHGAEAVVAVAYDGFGVWVENEWSARWGIRGYALLSWRFVDRYAREAWVIGVAPPTPPTTHSKARRALGTLAPTPPPTTPSYPYGAGTAVPTPSVSPISDTFASCPPSATPTEQPTTAPASPTVTPLASATAAKTTLTPAATPTVAAACASSGAPYAYTPYAYAPYPTSVAYPTDTAAYATVAPYPTDVAAYPTSVMPYPYPTDTGAYTNATPTASAPVATSTPPGNVTPTPTLTPSATATGAGAPPTASAPPTPPTPRGTAQVADLPASGPAGSTVFVSGTGFGPGAVEVYWNNAPAGLAFTDGSRFALTIMVPVAAAPGAGIIYAVNAATGVGASVTFTVLAPTAPTVSAASAALTATPVVPLVTPTIIPVALTPALMRAPPPSSS